MYLQLHPPIIINQQINPQPTGNDISLSCSASMHPYRNERHQSTTSLEMREKQRSIFSRLKLTFCRKDLPPLPESTYLLSSLSSTSSSSSTPYVIWSPSPLSEDDIAKCHVRHELGTSHPNHPITPYYGYVTSNKYSRVSAAPSPTPLIPATSGITS